MDIIKNILDAKTEWKEKYEKDYGEWGDFVIVDIEKNKLVRVKDLK